LEAQSLPENPKDKRKPKLSAKEDQNPTNEKDLIRLGICCF